MPDDIYASIDDMIALCERKVELLREMKKALRIADLLGIPPKDMKQKVSVSVRHGPSMASPWVGATYQVRVGDEPYEYFALTAVHVDLWPDDIRAARERFDNRRKRT